MINIDLDPELVSDGFIKKIDLYVLLKIIPPSYIAELIEDAYDKRMIKVYNGEYIIAPIVEDLNEEDPNSFFTPDYDLRQYGQKI